MRIKLLAGYHSPTGNHEAGAVIDVEDSDGRQLIAGRYAEPVGIAAKVAAASGSQTQPETATVKPRETRGGGRRGGGKTSAIKPPTP